MASTSSVTRRPSSPGAPRYHGRFVSRLNLHARLVAMLLLLVACGTTSTPSGGGDGGGASATAPTVTSTATPDPSAQVPLNWADQPAAITDGPVSLTVGIAGADELSGVYESLYPTLGIACDPQLVLTASALATPQVSPTDFTVLHNYLSSVPLTALGFPVPDRNTSPPSSLRWAAGSFGACSYQLQISNSPNSAHPVEISRVGVRLTAATTNQYHYALIDVCSIAADHFSECQGGLGGVGCDQVFRYDVQVTLRTVGSDSLGDVVDCAKLDISPGATQTVRVTLLPPAQHTAAVYQATPELTVKDLATQASNTFILPSFASTLVYAAPSQFTCYGLSNNHTWVPDSSLLSVNYNSFCV